MPGPNEIWIEDVPIGDEPVWNSKPDKLRSPHAYRRLRRGAEMPPGTVWLAPDCGNGICGTERLWCQDDVWGKCEEPDCRARPVPYAPRWDWVRSPERWRC